jgi:3-aminobutyryl-CoA ammonia-lyase
MRRLGLSRPIDPLHLADRTARRSAMPDRAPPLTSIPTQHFHDEHAAALQYAALRVRISSAEVQYAGGLVDGARILRLFGDLATELSVWHDRDEGLFRAYEAVEFLASVRAGDFIEAHGALLEVGRSSRRMAFAAYKVITGAPEVGPTAAEVLKDPIVVARAVGTTVTLRGRLHRDSGKTQT